MGCNSSSPGGQSGQRNSLIKQQMREQQSEVKLEGVDLTNVANFLGRVPLFQSLTNEDRQRVADSCSPAGFKRGEAIIKQGDLCKEFYFIMSGEVSVRFKPPNSVTEDKVAALKAGDYFGEAALLKDIPRAATIVAENVVQTLKMSREKFMELELTDKLVFPARKAVGAIKNVKAKPPSPKTLQERELIEKALTDNANLKSMVSLTKERIEKIIDLMWKENIPANTSIIKQGDLDAHYFYVVQDGQFLVSVSETGKSPQIVSTQTSGGSFGEIALLYLSARMATVKAKTDSVVWVIDCPNFQKLMKEENPAKQDEYVTCLGGVEMFIPLLLEEKKAIANAVVEKEFQKDELIIKQGDPGACLYILYDGEVSFSIDGKQIATHKASGYSGGKVIGERALITNEPRAATVTVTSEQAKCLALDRDNFNYLLGSMEDIVKRSSVVKNKQKKTKGTFGKIQRKDLVSLGLLGCGGFGSVELVQHCKTEELYALKSVSKGYIVECGMEENIMNEKDILVMASDSPFVIKLFETYNGSQNLYFLLEVCMGGELYAVYGNKNFTGSEVHAKYYTAGAITALKYLHSLRVIYRDLKPENVILTVLGEPKLIDMGLAKVVCGKTYTTCGTPSYFAPEVITQQGHCSAVDWWCVGILVFELMSGWAPFDSPDVMDMYKEIQKGLDHVEFPPSCQGSCQVFIKELCTLDPKNRLPVRLGGSNNIFTHEWYKGFDWEAFSNHKMPAPYKTQKGGDIKNFRANKAEKPTALKYIEDPINLWDKEFATVTSSSTAKGNVFASQTE